MIKPNFHFGGATKHTHALIKLETLDLKKELACYGSKEYCATNSICRTCPINKDCAAVERKKNKVRFSVYTQNKYR